MFVGSRQVYAQIAFKTTRICSYTCGPFPEHCERIQNFKETGDLNYI